MGDGSFKQQGQGWRVSRSRNRAEQNDKTGDRDAIFAGDWECVECQSVVAHPSMLALVTMLEAQVRPVTGNCLRQRLEIVNWSKGYIKERLEGRVCR